MKRQNPRLSHFLYFLTVLSILVIAIPVCAKTPSASKHQNKNNDTKRTDTCLTEEEVIALLKKKAPEAEVMFIHADFSAKDMHYEGRLFEDSKTNSPHNSDHVTKKKYEFELNAETGHFIRWHSQRYTFPKSRTSLVPDKIISMEEARKRAEEKVPGASVTAIQWDMNSHYVFYAGFMYREKEYYEFVINAYTGECLHLKERSPAKDAHEAMEKSILSQTAAERIALSKAPGAAVLNLNLEWVEQRPYYSGKLAKGHLGYTFTLDALSGKILTWKQYDLGRGVEVRSSHRYGPGIPVIPSTPIVTPPAPPPIPKPPRIPSLQPF